jgi:hypothetical protein
MNTFWAGLSLAAISLASAGDSGCNCAKFFGPRVEKPAIGTRPSAMGTLSTSSKTDSAKFLGCDIKYWNMPSGAKIKLVWQYYESEEDDTADNKTSAKAQDVSGSGIINAYLQSLDGGFEPGIYECKFTAEADKTVYDSPASARITVGKIKKGAGAGGKSKKAGDDDDDDSPKKKKKSKKEDDD